MSKQYTGKTAFACDLTALNAAQRRRYAQVRQQLHESMQEIREVVDGYAFRHPAKEPVLLLLAEFISLEGRCCPFLNFALHIKTERGPAWLTLTGPEGVKEFLRAEFDIDEMLLEKG